MNEQLEVVMKKMCKFANIKFQDVDFKDEENPYYQKYTWTSKQESDFKEWLCDYLYDNRIARMYLMIVSQKNKRIIKKFVDMFILNHGFKTVDRKNYSVIREGYGDTYID